MKTLILIATSLVAAVNLTQAFTARTTLNEQIQRADAIARVVVIEIVTLEYAETEEWVFTGLAKCRLVTDYTGTLRKRDFIYIPCNYNFDEDPSPLEAGDDCIIFLETMERSGIAHPVSSSAIHKITASELVNPEATKPETMISVDEFADQFRKQWETKKQNKSEMATPRKPSD